MSRIEVQIAPRNHAAQQEEKPGSSFRWAPSVADVREGMLVHPHNVRLASKDARDLRLLAHPSPRHQLRTEALKTSLLHEVDGGRVDAVPFAEGGEDRIRQA